jgi:hypothetical protein
MPGDDVIGECPYRILVMARGEILEGADAHVARGHAGQDRAGQRAFAINVLAGGDGRQRAGGGNAERVHGLTDQIFPQHRPEGGAAIAVAGKRGRARAFELDVAPRAGAVQHVPQQDGAAIAQRRGEHAELVTGIGGGDGGGAVGQQIAGKECGQGGVVQIASVQTQIGRQSVVELDQAWGWRGGGRLFGVEARR